MNRTRIKQTTAAIAACATVAAVVGIATGAAAPSNSNSNGNASGPSFEYGTAVGPPPGGGFATDSAFQQKMLKQFRQHFKNLPKPPSGVPGGMPPGLPPALGRRGN